MKRTAIWFARPLEDPMKMFRVMLVTLGLVVGVHAAASTLAKLSSLDRPPFPSDPAKISSPSAAAVPGWLEIVSPFRSDLESNHALILALQTLQSGSERINAGRIGPKCRHAGSSETNAVGCTLSSRIVAGAGASQSPEKSTRSDADRSIENELFHCAERRAADGGAIGSGNLIQRSRRSRRQGTRERRRSPHPVKTTRIEACRGFSL